MRGYGIIRTVKKETRNINGKEEARVMSRYKKFDVVRIDLGKNMIGSEQGGVRPAVIIQNDVGNKHSSTTIIIPFSSKIKHLDQPTHSLFVANKEYGLDRNSVLLGECIRSISNDRILCRIGRIEDDNDKAKIKRVYDANWG